MFVTENRARQNRILSAIDGSILQTLLEVACEVAKSLTRREFLRQAIVEYSNGDDNRQVILDQYPVSSIDTIEILANDGSVESTYDAVISPTIDESFVWDPKTGIIECRDSTSCFPKGIRNIKVTYAAGSVPAMVEEAVVRIAAQLYVENKTNPLLKSEKLGDWSGAYRAGDSVSDLAYWGSSVASLLGPHTDMSKGV